MLSVFIGLHNYVSASKQENTAAYAITMDGIMVAQQNLIGKAISNTSLDYVNDIKLKTGLLGGAVTFDAMSETFSVFFNKEIVQRVSDRTRECIQYAKEQKNKDHVATWQNNFAAFLRELKLLLDDWIISQDEFDTKKKQLLNL